MTKPLESLINEVRLFYQSLVQIGDELHADLDISMGMRAVLEYLDRNGDTTVPDIARARRVTRQRIQTLVNALLDRGLVDTRDNPASRRSPLVTLTADGVGTIRDMRRREGEALEVDVADRRIHAAETTLRTLRETLERRSGRAD